MPYVTLLAILLTSSSAMAAAMETLNQSTSSYFQGSGQGFLSYSVLESTCISSEIFADEIPCSAASLAQATNVIFGANFILGDDFETLYQNNELISANDKRGLALNLIKSPGTMRFETSSQMWAKFNNMAVVFVPFRWTYFSNVVNASYADISVHAMQEQSLSYLIGADFESNYRFGLAVRGVERKVIHETFNLFDALADIEKYLNVRTQRILYFEPSLIYNVDATPTPESWRPRLTGKLNQLGFVSEKIESLPVKPYLEIGVGVNPPVERGILEILLSYKITDSMNEERKYRIGSVYHLGLASFLMGLDSSEWSFGITNTFRFVNVGLNYKRNVFLDAFGGKSYNDSAVVEFRVLM